MSWDTTDKRLKTYGEYDNNSKFVYVEMNADVDAGATDPTLLPLVILRLPRFRAIYDLNATGACSNAPGERRGANGRYAIEAFFVTGGVGIPWPTLLRWLPLPWEAVCYLSGGLGIAAGSGPRGPRWLHGFSHVSRGKT